MPGSTVPGLPLPAASGQVGAVRDYLYAGFTIRNTSAVNPVTVRLWPGTAAGNPNQVAVLEEISLVASESRSENYPRDIRASGGIYFELVAGAVEGAIRAY